MNQSPLDRVHVDLELQVSEQVTLDTPLYPDFVEWVSCALAVANYSQRRGEMAIRVVDLSEAKDLNSQYRNKDKPTNVLSFPAELPDFLPSEVQASLGSEFLGDIALCADLVQSESLQQGKPAEHHWAHLTIHGCLHLLGYDHIEPSEAKEMESLEVKALNLLNIPDPY